MSGLIVWFDESDDVTFRFEVFEGFGDDFFLKSPAGVDYYKIEWFWEFCMEGVCALHNCCAGIIA